MILSLLSLYNLVQDLSVHGMVSSTFRASLPVFILALYTQRCVPMVFINPVIRLTVMINHYTLQTLDGLPYLCRDNIGYLLGLLGRADAQERLGLFPFPLSERS